MAAMITPEEAIRELVSTTCKACGGSKPRGRSHCRRCYHVLPKAMQWALYRKVGHGYEEAYAASLDHLHRERNA